MATEDAGYAATLSRFSGFADKYDRFRPAPPAALIELLPRIAQVERPQLVVDLGCGTSLSTRFWSARAERVIGVDPTPDMLTRAAANTSAENVTYRTGYGHATALPEGSADIVMCMQSLHWMEPGPTFAEVRRILRPGGVFAACDYDMPPVTPSWEAAALWLATDASVDRLEALRGSAAGVRQWSKSEHVARMQECGQFRFAREIVLHHQDDGTAERLAGLLMSLGSLQSLLKAGVSEEQLGIDILRRDVVRLLGNDPQPWLWSARVRVAVV